MKPKSIICSNTFIFLAIYIVALIITIYGIKIESDRLAEYNQYLQVIQNGGIIDFNNGLVNSSLLTIWLPAQIQLLTHLNPEFIFNILPCVLFSFMPAFVFLIARRYLDKWDSIISAGLILSSFYFAYYSAHGRVNIAWGILSVLIWAILSKRLVWSIIFSLLLVVAHYGTVYMTLFVIAGAWLCLLFEYIRKHDVKQELKNISIILVVLIIGISVWYGLVAKYTGKIVEDFVQTAISNDTPSLSSSPIIIDAIPTEQRNVIYQEYLENTPTENFFKLESRDSVVQIAFGKSLPYMSIPQKIEFALSWFVISLFSFGLLYAFIKKKVSRTYLWLSVAFYCAIVLTIIVPHISVYYGVVRVYFTCMVVLAPLFVIGVNRITDWIKIPRHIMPSIIALFYGLCVSGVVHSWFGIIK